MMARYGVYTGAAGSPHPLDGKKVMTTIEAVERLNGLTAAVEQLTAQRDALAAACREMLANHGREFRWDADGKLSECNCDCPGCVAALALVTAVKEAK